jgi:short-subunit dehydrogenase
MFSNKTVLITGASSGLGAALAHAFAEVGANLALFSFEKERQEEVAASCRRLGVEAVPVIGDVTSTEDCARYIDTAVSELGGIDVLLCNAGISMWSKFEDIEDLGIFRKLMEVNFMGAINCIHPALPHLRKSKGVITAITSIQSKIGVPLHTGYVASKHALQGFCESLRMELEGSGVDILTVLPHWIRGTDLRKNALSGQGKALGESSRKHSSESVSVEEACSAILDAIRDRRRDLILPWKLKVLMALHVVAPNMAESIIKGAVSHQDAAKGS